MRIKRSRDASPDIHSPDGPATATSKRAKSAPLSALERLPAEVLQKHIVPELQSFRDGSLAAFAAASRMTHMATMAGVLRPQLGQLRTAQLHGVFGGESSLAPPPYGQAHPAALACIALKRISALLDRHGFATGAADISMVPKTRTAAMQLDTLNVAVDMLFEPHPQLSMTFVRELAAAVQGLRGILFAPLTAWVQSENSVPGAPHLPPRESDEIMAEYHQTLITSAGTDTSYIPETAYDPPQYKTVPPWWLYFVNLSNIEMISERFEVAPAELAYLPKVNEMSVIGPLRDLPESMAQLTELRKLTLRNRTMVQVPAVISRLTQLTELVLNVDVPPNARNFGFEGLVNLKSLNLGYWGQIPESIFSLTRLEHLSVNSVEHFPPSISNLKSLVSLDLVFGRFNELPKEMAQLSKLKKLNVGYNLNLMHFPYFVEHMPELEVLNLYACHRLPVKSMPRIIGNLITMKDNIYQNMKLDLSQMPEL